jgi:hypothetical protein
MNKAVGDLKRWFVTLDASEQEAVIQFLYEGKALVRKGLYFGPAPGLVNEGLYCGPAPQSATTASSSVSRCPHCGKPY